MQLRLDAMAAPLLGVELCLLEPVLFDHEAETAGSLFRPLYSLCTHRGAAYPEEPGEAPSRGKRAQLGSRLRGCDLDVRGIDACAVANAHEHTHILRPQPHRRVGALVVALPKQQPPDRASQCINHGRRRAERHRVDVYAIDATPSIRLSG